MGFIIALLGSCTPGNDAAAVTVEGYLNALVAQDGDRMSSLSCKDWEPQALMELDSFQAVKVTIEGLSCDQRAAMETFPLLSARVRYWHPITMKNRNLIYQYALMM